MVWLFQTMAGRAMPALSLLVPRNEQSSCIPSQQLDRSVTQCELPLVCVVVAENMGRGVPSFAGMKTRPPAPGLRQSLELFGGSQYGSVLSTIA